MDLIFHTLNRKLFEANRHKELNAKFKTFTDEERVTFIFNLLEEFGIQPESTNIQKDAEASNFFREMGNRTYIMSSISGSQLDLAWKAYSKSIARAPLRSKELALAYGNRSAVLFRFKKYKECVRDIERALNLDYPSHMKSILLLRKQVCLRNLQEPDYEETFEEAHGSMKKMSLTECSDSVRMNRSDTVQGRVKGKEYHLPKIAACNSEVPFASDAVAVKYNDIFGRHLVAARDIKPGETLAVEKPYALMLNTEKMYTHCAQCLNVAWDGIPCDHCVYVMFCSEECKEEAWNEFHDVECPVISCLLQLDIDMFSLLSMRLAIITMKKAGSSEALRKELQIVDNWKDPRTRGYQNDGKFNSEDYRAVYSLMTMTDKTSVSVLFRMALDATYILFFLATRSKLFGKKLKANLPALVKNSELTLVGGMMLRHQQIIQINMLRFCEQRDFETTVRGVAIAPFLSFSNHSCNPNIVDQSIKEHLVLYAIQPIRKGEQLFSTYTACFFTMGKDARQKRLKYRYYFDCHCRPCEENWPTYIGLPSFTHWVTCPQEVKKIKKVLRDFGRYQDLVIFRNVETEPNMLKNMYKMVEVLSTSVPMPCIELVVVIQAIVRAKELQGNRFDMPKT
ncbi:SET and MYND domain-containing protein 4-like [Orussus abietinus]|uniref:SET and MYND domain-containing protein 4-like n=1 Tax=Orussus abietinus TaxID=222816 RepID=UPI000C715FFE|nr:SET and MYND domain-containing protein 4-like [Orussus abietinus]